MKIVCALTILFAIATASVAPPPLGASAPGYTLANYQNYLCQGDAGCLSQLPSFGYLNWSPINGVGYTSRNYWRWVFSGSSSSIVCRQDYYPIDGYSFLCREYKPNMPGWSAEAANICGSDLNSNPCVGPVIPPELLPPGMEEETITATCC